MILKKAIYKTKKQKKIMLTEQKMKKQNASYITKNTIVPLV